jgi:hypothetical protein
LTRYVFNTKKNHHYFCRRCGVRAFGVGNETPIGRMYGVNVGCLDDVADEEIGARTRHLRRRPQRPARPARVLRAPVSAGGVMDEGKPYVVRFGPWARNLYLGLPAAAAFALISVVAEMPLALAIAWNLVVALVVVICAFTREVRIYPGVRVVEVRRLLALIPVWRRTHPWSDVKGVAGHGVAYSFVGDAEVAAHTVYIVLKSGRLIPVQSYASGADNQPPLDVLNRELAQIARLPRVGKG